MGPRQQWIAMVKAGSATFAPPVRESPPHDAESP